MSILLIILHVIACLVLIAVILLQAGRGQGFGGTFGSGEGTQTIFGTRSADFLSKATTVCAVMFLFTCLGLDVMEARKGSSLLESAPKLKTEDLKALQDALKELEAKEAAGKTPEAAAQAASEAIPDAAVLSETVSPEAAATETALSQVASSSLAAIQAEAVVPESVAAVASESVAAAASESVSVPSNQPSEPEKAVEQK